MNCVNSFTQSAAGRLYEVNLFYSLFSFHYQILQIKILTALMEHHPHKACQPQAGIYIFFTGQ
jgi:hypothetical protein